MPIICVIFSPGQRWQRVRRLQDEIGSVERIDHEVELDPEVRHAITGDIGIEDRDREVIFVLDEVRNDEKLSRLGEAIAVVEKERFFAAEGLTVIDLRTVNYVILPTVSLDATQ